MSLGPNDLQPCGSRGARVRHAAGAQLCSVCEPMLERPGHCPVCGDRVTILGDTVLGHDQEGVDEYACPGSGTEVAPLLPRPARVPVRPRRVQVMDGAA